LASTSAEVFSLIASGGRPTDEHIAALAAAKPSELFGELIEPLSDAFEPAYAAAYNDLFVRLLEMVSPALQAADLLARHAQLRAAVPNFEPRRVVVLSRVTLGADVAVTSTFLAAALAKWPDAEICFAGPAKNHELFAGHPRIELLPVKYLRTGPLAERIAAGLSLAGKLDRADTLVIDPDSRLSQLGLLPLAPPERTLYFPSRSLGAAEESLVAISRRFAAETLGVKAAPFLQPPAPEWVPKADVALSFGVGENPAKRLDAEFELQLVQGLLDSGRSVLLDSGAPGTEEAARAKHIADTARGPLIVWEGSFAPFAAAITRSRLYIGYDSAGQHVAAAAGVHRITVFAGYPNERFLARWRPDGAGTSIVIPDSAGALEAALAAATRLSGAGL
jgi:ADP-heptose:LPS heptosyltransferase